MSYSQDEMNLLLTENKKLKEQLDQCDNDFRALQNQSSQFLRECQAENKRLDELGKLLSEKLQLCDAEYRKVNDKLQQIFTIFNE